MRLFIGIDCNHEKEYFQQLQKQFPEGRYSLAQDFHITLKFLGEVDQACVEAIKNALARIVQEPFTLSLKEVNDFDQRVIILNVTSPELLILQRSVDAALVSLFDKEQRYSPHVTLARMKELGDESFFSRVSAIKTVEKQLFVQGFFLYESVFRNGRHEYKKMYEKRLGE